MATLLMTGTIDSSYFGNVSTCIQGTDERKSQYYNTLERYIKESKFKNIVFAENSNYLFDYDYFQEMALKYNKNFEFIKVQTDIEKTHLKGKAYGEANLISEAIKKSIYIKEENFFYKVTGRVYIENINRLINENLTCEFITNNVYCWCQTVFFKVTLDVYERCLKDAEDFCNDFDGKHYIEMVYYEKLAGENVRCFKQYPEFCGVGGGSGMPYNRSKVNLLLKNLLIKLGYYDYRRKYLINKKIIEKLGIIISKMVR